MTTTNNQPTPVDRCLKCNGPTVPTRRRDGSLHPGICSTCQIRDNSNEVAAEVVDLDTRRSQQPAPLSRTLRLRTVAEVRADLAQRGERPWLIRGLWPGDAYGVLGGPDKAGKTWALLDLAVSVAAGLPWLGRFDCPNPGPVALFLGEGGDAGMMRRLDAVCAHKGVKLDDLPILLEFRAPNLTDTQQVLLFAELVTAQPFRFIGLDPWYLMTGGRAGSQLNEMGQILSVAQAAAEDAGAALAVMAHWTKSGEGRGPERFTGVGPGAWGRVLGSAGVSASHTDPNTRETSVTLAWTFKGGEIADCNFTTLRRVRADDPADLESALHYQVEVTGEGAPVVGDGAQLSRTQLRLLRLLQTGGPLQTVRQLQQHTDRDGGGKPLQGKTVNNNLTELEKLRLVEGTDTALGVERHWSITPAGERAAADA